MIQEMLPLGITCPRETRDLLLDCCVGKTRKRGMRVEYELFKNIYVEFIHLIASESNEVCEKSNKKTISPEHVLEALKNLSFDAYIEEVEAEYHEHQAQSKSKEKTKGSKLELSGLTEEELLRQQEELFERARLRMNSSSTSTTTTTGSIDAEKEPSTAVAAAAAADNEDNTESAWNKYFVY